MSSLSPNERALIRSVVDAFRPPGPGLSAEQIADRGARFIEDLASSGSDRVDQIRLTLALLDGCLNALNERDRASVRARSDVRRPPPAPARLAMSAANWGALASTSTVMRPSFLPNWMRTSCSRRLRAAKRYFAS